MHPDPYLANLQRLLALEEQEALESYRREVLQRGMNERKQRGTAWFPVQLAHQEFGFGERFYLSFERLSQLGRPHQFQVGDKVAVSAYDKGQASDSLQGVVTALWPDRMKVSFQTDELPDWLDGQADLGIDLLFDEASFREMRSALEQALQAKGRLRELREVLLGRQEARTDASRPAFPSPQLNASQQEAVRRVLQAEDVAIIHGPPGTGKTTTLVQAIKQVLDAETQVLVCAPSNVAADLLTQRLAAKGVRVLRIGNPARVADDQLAHTLEAQIASHPDYKLLRKLRRDADEYRSIARKYKRNFGKEEREQRKLLMQESKRIREQSENLERYLADSVLGSAQAITCTLVGAANRYLEGRTFSTVFIDEAGQALAPACWIPIARAGRVVMAGDHCQLPPTVKSQQAAQEGLQVTLMEHALAQQPALASLLTVQYRMHAHIMGFSSQAFYHGALAAHETAAARTLYPGAEAFSFIDTAGCGFEEARDEAGSTYNEGEAGILLAHLRQLFDGLQADHPEVLAQGLSIGLISPYQAQVALLKEALAGQAWADVAPFLRVHSVDGFQGQEQDVVYVSLVRSNDKGGIGFLQDTRRLNVALTRARKRLVVLGDSATIGQHPFYRQFLEYAEQAGGYASAWEWM
jgi:superfamily I DNA and/or RNA helicase